MLAKLQLIKDLKHMILRWLLAFLPIAFAFLLIPSYVYAYTSSQSGGDGSTQTTSGKGGYGGTFNSDQVGYRVYLYSPSDNQIISDVADLLYSTSEISSVNKHYTETRLPINGTHKNANKIRTFDDFRTRYKQYYDFLAKHYSSDSQYNDALLGASSALPIYTVGLVPPFSGTKLNGDDLRTQFFFNAEGKNFLYSIDASKADFGDDVATLNVAACACACFGNSGVKAISDCLNADKKVVFVMEPLMWRMMQDTGSHTSSGQYFYGTWYNLGQWVNSDSHNYSGWNSGYTQYKNDDRWRYTYVFFPHSVELVSRGVSSDVNSAMRLTSAVEEAIQTKSHATGENPKKVTNGGTNGMCIFGVMINGSAGSVALINFRAASGLLSTAS